MSWTPQSAGRGNVGFITETYTLPSSATREYSSVIEEFYPNIPQRANRYIMVGLNPSAVSGTNLDIALYGSTDRDGTTKVLLVDAIVADITATGWVFGQVDLNAYPFPYYFIAWTPDADESANTIQVLIAG